MKILILKENFQTAAVQVARFVTSKATLPVLSYIGIRATKEGIFLYGTDMELSVRVLVRGNVEVEGEVALPAKILTELLSVAALGPIELEVNEGAASFKAGKMKAKIQGMGFDEFPVWEADLAGMEILGDYEIDSWNKVWEKIGFSLSGDEARPVLKGFCWELNRGRIVATDGYRLSMEEDPIYKAKIVDNKERLLVPGRFVREGVKILDEQGVKKITLYYDKEKAQVWMGSGEALLMGRLLEGEYPNYEAIVPGTMGDKVGVSAAELLHAVKSAAIFAKDSARIVKIKFTPTGMLISANAAMVGENEVEVGAETGGKEIASVAFNSRFLIDFLSRMGEKNISILVTESLKPVLFLGEEGRGYKHVIMPVRVRESE